MALRQQAAVAQDTTERLLSGWGRTAPTRATVRRPRDGGETVAALAAAGHRGTIARGLGRSYGDAAQNAGGTVLDMTGLDAVGPVDAGGEITVGAGASLAGLLTALLPVGWMPPVMPGTRFVTVGGAVAADVHGKNHHRDGSFCDHVTSLRLLTPGGDVVDVTRESDPDLFAATAGGMGLTGVVLAATLRLTPMSTAAIRAEHRRVPDLDRMLALLEEDPARYSVAWVDMTAPARARGRGEVILGEHADADAGRHAAPGTPRIPTPRGLPSGLLSAPLVRLGCAARYRMVPGRRSAVEGVGPFFFPLDGIRDWNRVYGPGGLVQHQFVVPPGRADVVRFALDRVARSGVPAPLAVLKRLGAGRGMLAFPIEGWTLAVDFPARAHGLARLLDDLDDRVAEAGGRVYLAKDSRMRPEMLTSMYPDLARFSAVRARIDPDARLRSDLARRLGLA
ncbi:MAG TPA: FAD-binding oxidoreductase [Solirubrobacteraceae bacterium]